MCEEVDILENVILENYPNVLEILLRDHTTQQNIFWATNNYENLGEAYSYKAYIRPDLITGDNGKLIMPRVQKNKILQQSRVKDMAEVFTPSWICNAQNNLIDNAWFGRNNVFNKEIIKNTTYTWLVNSNKITFPESKSWKHYVRDKRLEIACGEAPYITSRYDTTTGEFIPINRRIGVIDRKLRVVNENVNNSGEWLKAVQIAYRSTYAFEWQGDSLLLAREAMLYTFIENYRQKFKKEPLIKSIQYIAYIISWNVWQMDGLKAVVPLSCKEVKRTTVNLFGEEETKGSFCSGCLNNNIFEHNGIYCLVKDWSNKDFKTRKKGRRLRFIDLIKK